MYVCLEYHSQATGRAASGSERADRCNRLQQQGKRLQVASARIGCTWLHLPRANRLHSAMPTCMCGLQRVATQHNCKPVSGVNKRQRVFIWSNRGKAYWVSKARIPVDTSPRSISQSSAILLTRKHASRQQSISSQQSKHCVCKTYEPSSSLQRITPLT